MDGFEKRREQKKRDILNAALALFMEYGLQKVSITEIAKKANVSQVTIYNYFESKENLVRLVFKFYVDQIWDEQKHLLVNDLPFNEKIKKIIRDTEKVGCTGCAYCMPCPHGVDIPETFLCYNKMYSENKTEGRFEYARNIGVRKIPGFATQCVGCGACEKHCPQHIPIREKLKEADKALRPLPYKVITAVARKLTIK